MFIVYKVKLDLIIMGKFFFRFLKILYYIVVSILR